ncbi:MAG: T9SS type A sorting domain-containing protein [Bacteroidales bacterium]|nr:T9SS type A sorting domain-containing protein [Bacteroidales bacterium]
MNPKTKILLTLFLISGFFLPVNSLLAQIQITLDTTENCAGDTILIPINVYQFDSIGSITLFIDYDTNVVEYLGHINAHNLVSGMLSNAMRSGLNNTGPLIGKIGMSWAAGMGPVSLGNAKLLDLKFHFLSDSCDLTFDPGSEITNYEADPLPVNYSGATINEIPPPGINSQPSDTTVVVGNNASFQIVSTGLTLYQWQVDSNGTWYDLPDNATYSGVTTDSLKVNSCQLSMNNYQFRCLLSGCIDIYSNPVALFVSPASSIMNKSHDDFTVQCYPNPFSDHCTISYDLNEAATVTLSIYNYSGMLISRIPVKNQHPSQHQITIDAKDLNDQAGMYFYRMEFLENGVQHITSGRIAFVK